MDTACFGSGFYWPISQGIFLLQFLEKASMLLWVSLLVLAPVSGKIAPPRPVISLQPPWTPVFQGETVLLTCGGFGFYAPGKTTWYSKLSEKETPGNTLKVHTSGQYRCQTQDSPPSSPVYLQFYSASLILQSPHSVFEGDTLVLRCQKRGKEKLMAVKYFLNGNFLSHSNESLQFLIPRASSKNSGSYTCIGYEDKKYLLKSANKIIRVQELFPLPKLKATASQPTDGNPVNLSCHTQLHPERLHTPLHFSFFRDKGVILSNWSRSPELQIPSVWSEDSGRYWCEARTANLSVRKCSLPLRIQVQRVPVSGVLMETRPPGGQAVEGEKLVLVCSMAEGTGDTTFSWHRENMNETVGRTSQRSQRAEMQIPVISESDAGEYYCAADNGFGPIQSEVMNITVRRTVRNRSDLIAAGIAGGLLGILLLPVALPFYLWLSRKSGDGSLGDTTRTLPTPVPGQPPYSTSPVPVEPQPWYENVHHREGNSLYSEIQIFQLGEEEANTARTSSKYKDASVVYSEVKTQLPDDSAGQVISKDEESMDSYETITLKRLAPNPESQTQCSSQELTF
ncbi:Fc receptor-like protein 4 isoform X2 [Loxodonta africana]|uniref:Fc receptor-like protein 4 isoform X2 n=1 Tax=Loxodonta africana TaxID=9785 RepID=UPI000C810C45|nr:Fc receptor-like protein 4 isoform X2 [Loxodonta africana]